MASFLPSSTRRSNMNELQTLVDNIRLDGSVSSNAIDELAAAIRNKLDVEVGDDRIYRDLAERFVQFKIEKHRSQDVDDPHVSSLGKGSTGEPQPTWSSDSSSTEQAETEDDARSASPSASSDRSSDNANSSDNASSIENTRPGVVHQNQPISSEMRSSGQGHSPKLPRPGRSGSVLMGRRPSASSSKNDTRSASPLRKVFARISRKNKQANQTPPTQTAPTPTPTSEHTFQASPSPSLATGGTGTSPNYSTGPIDSDEVMFEHMMSPTCPTPSAGLSRLGGVETVQSNDAFKSPQPKWNHDEDTETSPMLRKSASNMETDTDYYSYNRSKYLHRHMRSPEQGNSERSERSTRSNNSKGANGGRSRSRTPSIFSRRSKTPDRNHADSHETNNGRSTSTGRAPSPFRNFLFRGKNSRNDDRSNSSKQTQVGPDHSGMPPMPPRSPLEPSTTMNTQGIRSSGPERPAPTPASMLTSQSNKTPTTTTTKPDDGFKTAMHKARRKDNGPNKSPPLFSAHIRQEDGFKVDLKSEQRKKNVKRTLRRKNANHAQQLKHALAHGNRLNPTVEQAHMDTSQIPISPTQSNTSHPSNASQQMNVQQPNPTQQQPNPTQQQPNPTQPQPGSPNPVCRQHPPSISLQQQILQNQTFFSQQPTSVPVAHVPVMSKHGSAVDVPGRTGTIDVPSSASVAPATDQTHEPVPVPEPVALKAKPEALKAKPEGKPSNAAPTVRSPTAGLQSHVPTESRTDSAPDVAENPTDEMDEPTATNACTPRSGGKVPSPMEIDSDPQISNPHGDSVGITSEHQGAEGGSEPDKGFAPINTFVPGSPINPVALDLEFSVGVGDKTPSRGRNQSARRRGGGSIGRGRNFRRNINARLHTAVSAQVEASPQVQEDATVQVQGANSSQVEDTDTTRLCRVPVVDYSGTDAKVQSMREEARSSYLAFDYRKSILQYTKAIELQCTKCRDGMPDDTFAVLLSNRAAGLLMIGAFDAAVSDCQTALRFVSDISTSNKELLSDSGIVLKAKLYIRLARAYLKLGECDKADSTFDSALETVASAMKLGSEVSEVRDKLQFEQNQVTYQIETDAKLGQSDVNRVREATSKLVSMLRSPDRHVLVEALGHATVALSIATGSVGLHERKVVLLSRLKRWREVANHCERLASANVKFDGIFSGDLAALNPFPGVPPAKVLTSDFFGDTKAEDAVMQDLKLSSKGAAEAVLRLPVALMPSYLRSLRLEERYPAAEAALVALEGLVSLRGSSDDEQHIRMKFAWLSRERGKLTRTKSGRDRGDELFRIGHFDLAAAQYASCLMIDAEGNIDSVDGCAGGRLHAVLHCNRAACLMALRRFSEAVTECTSALRIHSRYMKAMLRRGRCYSRLERYEEAVAEYKRWLEYVEEARKSPELLGAFTSPCIFDGPLEVSAEDIVQVKQELNEVTKTKRQSEEAARAEHNYRQERQRWHTDTFQSSHGSDDARRRREQWYNQHRDGPRRWDSFNDWGPQRSSRNQSQYNRSNSANSWRTRQSHQSREHENRQTANEIVGTPEPTDHYSVLEVASNATEAEIKKAYRKMALKLHPDKNKEADAADRFRRLKMAYEVLNDEVARRKYDAEMRWNRRF